MRTPFADAQQALGFLVHQLSYIEPGVYETVYPEIQYPQLIPVDTSANEWAKSVTYYSSDKAGKAGWFHHRAKDLHLADVERSKHETTIEMADIGYDWTLEELGQAMQIPGQNLSGDRAQAARRASEEMVDDIALVGDADKLFYGLTNYPGITVINAAAVGNNGSPAWEDKVDNPDLILRDVNDALTGQWVITKGVELSDTLLLPMGSVSLLATTRIPQTTMTVLQFLLENNVYTFKTGRPLTIRMVRGLETAGSGGTGRMVAYRRDPSILKMHIPMPHRFLPPWQTAPLVFTVPGIFRLGGLEIKRPMAVRYIDGISTPPYE